MARRVSNWMGSWLLLAAALWPAAACTDDVTDPDSSGGDLGQADSSAGDVIAGAILFNKATFGGNGRTCATCHPSGFGQSGTLNPSQIQALFKQDPTNALFRWDGADTLGGKTFTRIQRDATVLIDMPLPGNVSIEGSSARDVVLARGIPTTMNTPALDGVLMYDGRAPNLQEQARGAIEGHAQTTAVTRTQLDQIAAFQQFLFNRLNLFALARLGRPTSMPYGRTDSEKRGRRFFIADDQTDPDQVGEQGELCGACHSGPMLNETSAFFGQVFFPGVPEGTRFFTAFVSELNEAGNQVHDFDFTNPDGSVTTVSMPDPGLALQTGDPSTAGFFKIPTVWGVRDTAPYFHDSSAKSLEQLMDHYTVFLNIITDGDVNLTEQDKADAVAYLKLL
jgi:cytochrome c peroxidase